MLISFHGRNQEFAKGRG